MIYLRKERKAINKERKEKERENIGNEDEYIYEVIDQNELENINE